MGGGPPGGHKNFDHPKNDPKTVGLTFSNIFFLEKMSSRNMAKHILFFPAFFLKKNAKILAHRGRSSVCAVQDLCRAELFACLTVPYCTRY